MESPREFAARLTASFALSYLKPHSTVLDVGSGDGVIAASMKKGGLDVSAIDINEEAVLSTTATGVTCQRSELQNFSHEPFDGLLCSRSIHHVEALDRSLANAKKLLKDDGLLLVEEFGFERIDEKTAVWLVNLAQLVSKNSGKNVPLAHNGKPRHQWLIENYNGDSNALERVRQHHEQRHNISSYERVKSAVMDHFEIIEEVRIPFLFQYISDFLPATKAGAEHAQLIYTWEKEQAESGGIAMCGARLVARKAR
jgi:ubiquinone/menaquinone biosynthesis C-methylase UbiE